MGFSMNSGYFGWSMSRNAVAAYEDGEKPRSKWTKAAILAAVAAYCDEFDLVPDAGLSKLTKTELFGRALYNSSWHHTSKFCNVTEFYALDEDFVCANSRPMTPGEISARDSAREAEKAAREARALAAREARALAARRRAAYEAEHGFPPTCLLAYMDARPELCETFVSKRSNRPCVRYTVDCKRGGERVTLDFTCPLEDAARRVIDGFDATEED